MVGWWPGDGNANDIIGSNNGTLVGGATFAPGLVGQAFSLNGSNAFVDAGNASSLKVSSGDFTVDAWVNFGALTHLSGNNGRPLGDMSIVDKMGNAVITQDNSDGWRLIKQDNNQFWLCFAAQGGSNGCGGSAATTVTSTTVATTGTWFHVAAVKSSSEIAIYLNGVKEGTKPLPPFNDTNSANLLIGSNAQYGAFLNGLVDEVEVFNRALSAAEIQSIFNAGSAGKCKTGAAQPTAISVAAVSSVYGGTANLQATLTQVSSNSGVSGKTISFTLNSKAVVGTPVTDTSGVATLNGISLVGINAGTYATGVGASFAGDSNFAASSGTAPLTISKANANVTLTNLNPNYDGTPKSATATTTPNGLAVTFTYNGSATPPKNAGSYTVVGTINDNNYQGNSSGTLTIKKVPLKGTANNATRPYGAPNPPFGVTYSGFVNLENSSVVTGTLSCTTTAVSGNGAASPGSLPGNYPITCSGQTSNNYTITYVAGTLTIVAAPLVRLSATSILFPNQLVGVPSGQRNVTLTNAGDAVLSISSIAISGDFLQTNTCGSSVAIGRSCIISVRFTPTTTGTRTGAVTITDNAYDSPQKINLTGTGIAAVVFPTSLTFAARRRGTTSPPQLVFLININNAAMSISPFTFSGPNGGDFNQTNNCGTSLNARSPCIIRVSFTPSGTGLRTGTLQINDSDPSSPQLVTLRGTGR